MSGLAEVQARMSAIGSRIDGLAVRRAGVDPLVGSEFDPAPLAHQFDLVLDTAGSLPAATARAAATGSWA